MGAAWFELLDLMINGPDRSLRGAIRSVDPDEPDSWSVGFHRMEGQPMPVHVGVARTAAPYLVWLDGDRVRIERPDGRPSLISDGEQCWKFPRGDDLPVRSPASALRLSGPGMDLLQRRDQDSWLGTDFTRPTGPPTATTFLGRDAWAVELAPPSHKPHPLQLVVDAETGLVLQQRNDGFGTVDEWVELVVGEDLADALFTWAGEARDHVELEVDRQAQWDEERRARLEWFQREVRAAPLRVAVTPEVNLHNWDDETGAFEASLREGVDASLARRPRSDEAWDLHWHGGPIHRWTHGPWDWALMRHAREDFEPEALASLQEQLGIDG